MHQISFRNGEYGSNFGLIHRVSVKISNRARIINLQIKLTTFRQLNFYKVNPIKNNFIERLNLLSMRVLLRACSKCSKFGSGISFIAIFK